MNIENNFVVYARFVTKSGYVETETIDVGAINWQEAKKTAEKILETDYDPGGEVYIITDGEGRKVWEKPAMRRAG